MKERIDIRKYVQNTVISHLERLMDGGNASDRVQEDESYPYGVIDRNSEQYEAALHELMVPYYDMYLNGDPRLCKPNMENVRWHMKHTIDDDDLFGAWASEQDLIIAAEGWGKNMQRIPEDFQRMLREHRPKSYREVEDESTRPSWRSFFGNYIFWPRFAGM